MGSENKGLGVKWKLIVAALCLVVCGTVLVFICAKKIMQPPPRVIYDTLERLVAKENARIVEFAEPADFEWDDLYAFPPYTGEDEVSSLLGEKFVITQERSYGLSRGDVLAVFVHDDNVVYHEFIAPKYRLFGAHGSFVIPREKAVFEVAGGPPYTLRQIDPK